MLEMVAVSGGKCGGRGEWPCDALRAEVDPIGMYQGEGEEAREDEEEIGMSKEAYPMEGLSLPLAERVSMAQVRKVLRTAQVEAVRARLRGLRRSCVSYEDMIPQVAKAIENMIPTSLPEEEREELKEVEEKKASIDAKAESLMRREMWCGLGFLALQTTDFMRLIFWELSWDVMEPIKTHFAAMQRRLVKTHSFDMEWFNQLRKGVAFCHCRLLSLRLPPHPFSHRHDCHHSSTL
ncbi:hypothetical protein Cni_G09781 [Canna indica]|uniref:Calcium uniporter protein C-terminal domain-containing protein n=1 Tax=Canna indica TaxID=4628 RepID=A0AAQ3K343_9LILI|nr:hypothetical protein Cni_G09781 [Canna indica]